MGIRMTEIHEPIRNGFMSSKDILKTAYEAISDKKGENTRIIDISKVSVIADYFIVTNGSNVNQVQAIADSVEEKLLEAGVKLKQVEGNNNSGWILMDFGDVIVHVFSKEERFFYDLERIWSDGTNVEIEDL